MTVSSRSMLVVFVCAVVTLSDALVSENDTESSSQRGNVTEPLSCVSENNTETFSHCENVTKPRSHDVAHLHLCPVGWTYYHSRCFLYISCAMNWTEAQRFCQYMSANLASVHKPDEYEALQRVIKGNHRAWIGGSDMKREGEWEWADGSRFSYMFWCLREPNDRGNEDCLLVNWKGNGWWSDFRCAATYPFVCSK